MVVKIRREIIPLGIGVDGAIDYNPNRIKMVITTGAALYLQLYQGAYPAGGLDVYFVVGGGYAVGAGAVNMPPYLHLEGEEAQGPYGVYNPSIVGAESIQWIETIEKKTTEEEPEEAPEMTDPDKEPEEELRRYWPFTWGPFIK